MKHIVKHVVKHFVINLLALLVGVGASYRNIRMKVKKECKEVNKSGFKPCQKCVTKDSRMELRERLARVSREVVRLLPRSNRHSISEE
jgi:hypothetical protein